jgi:drug/metabolite transporter, DME family
MTVPPPFTTAPRPASNAGFKGLSRFSRERRRSRRRRKWDCPFRCLLQPTYPFPPLLKNRFAISGAGYCLISALVLTTANICMRKLTALRCDPMWAVFGRETVTWLPVVPYLLFHSMRGRPTLPSGRILRNILLIALLVQLAGNIWVQWALGIVGLAVTIPAQFGVMLVSSALLGRLWLGERVTLRSVTAITLVIFALVLLGMGAESAGSPASDPKDSAAGPLLLAIAVLAAAGGGTIFATMNIVIRHSVTRATPPSAMAFLMPAVGTFALGPICIYRLGLVSLLHTPFEQLFWMLGAGVFNLIGFIALIRGLERTTAVHANVVCASQVAMAAIVGIALFQEPPNFLLLLGVFLTITGILRFDHPVESGGV